MNKNSSLIHEGVRFREVQITRARGRPVIAVTDNENMMHILTRELIYIGKFSLSLDKAEEIIKVGKQNQNAIFYTKNKIGVARFVDGK